MPVATPSPLPSLRREPAGPSWNALRVGLLLAAGAGCMGAGEPATGTSMFPNLLRIPPILKPTSTAGGITRYDLTAHAGATRFLKDKDTATYGYNGMSYLGPTLRLQRGSKVRITLHNDLPADMAPPMPMALPDSKPSRDLEHLAVPYATSLHIHGLVGSAATCTLPTGCNSLVASGPTDLVAAGQGPASAVFKVDQPAATLWYHPLPLLDAGRQVYLGLSGLVLVDDPREAALGLPHAYGVDDLPLIVQDRRFGPDSGLLFRDRKKDVEGMLGNRILVNGTLTPYAAVAATRVRLRLVNASNARAYLFGFRDGRSFQQIASDGGLLAAPVEEDQVLVPPGGRAEIVADFSKDAGARVHLVSRGFLAAPVRDPLVLPNGGNFPVMEFQIGAAKPSPRLPAHLAKLAPADPSLAQNTRIFALEQSGENDDADGDTTINGKHFDPARIDQKVKAGAWEVWTLVNHSRDQPHAFHVQGTSFRVLKRNAGPLSADDQGWKDTLELAPRETARILLHFDRQEGIYRFDCQNLECQDAGMMGLFEVSR